MERAHVVMWGGGITSWATAMRVAERHGTDCLTLLFADTLAEDDDLHRFNREAAALVGVPITRVCDGRTPQQVNVDKRWLSNARLASCSHELKQKPCRRWLEDNTAPEATTVYVGIDWTELHRLPAIERGWAPWPVETPLTEPPWRTKRDLIFELRDYGVQEPALYRIGAVHNNCGMACVRGGQAQWERVLRTNPALFASWEAHEQQMRGMLAADVSILRDRNGGVTKPLPLSVLRQRIEQADADNPGFDFDDWGGCGCFTDEPSDGAA